jgi:hypothetical protein
LACDNERLVPASRQRLICRLLNSEFADRSMRTGTALLLLWAGEPIPPTEDVDLLGFGDTSAEALKRSGKTRLDNCGGRSRVNEV